MSWASGAIAFNFEPIHNLKGRCDAYKEAIANCTEPLGQFKNDNIMMTNAVICLEDRKRAREIALSAGRGYLNTMVAMYHDTMPPKPGAPVWPARPHAIPNEDVLDQVIAGGNMLCGTPDEVAEQLAAYEAVGCDQVVFGFPPEGAEPDEVTEIIELFGSKVIPQFDKDPVHSTTRYREQAQPKYPRFNNPDAVEGPLGRGAAHLGAAAALTPGGRVVGASSPHRSSFRKSLSRAGSSTPRSRPGCRGRGPGRRGRSRTASWGATRSPGHR